MLRQEEARAATVTAPPSAGAETAKRPGLQTFTSLRHRDYRLLWFGTLFSSSGQWIQQVSIGWLTYHITGSPFLLGAVNGMRALPLLLLGPFGGVAADRFDRKRLMQSTQLFQFIITAIFATVVIRGYAHIWNIIVYTLLTGVAWAFNMPVRSSVIPRLVPRADLMNALALNSAGFNVTRIIGPSFAGLMIAALGIGLNFYVQAAMYIGVSAMIWQMQIPPIAGAKRDVSVGRNLAEGARYVWSQPTLRLQMGIALLPVLVALPYTSLMPIFAKDVLNLGPGGFGLMMAAPGVGAFAATLFIATYGKPERRVLFIYGPLLALGVLLIAFALSRSVVLSLGLLVLLGAAQMTYNTSNQTVVQLATPDEFRGRVMGIYMLNQGLLPAGSLLAGTLADVLSAPTAVAIMGGVMVVMSVFVLLLYLKTGRG